MIARAGFAVAALLALTGAARPPATPAPPVLTIIATDFAFTVPGGANATVPAGPVTFRLVNHGKEIHMMGVVLLGDTTASAFIRALGNKHLIGTEVGGVNGVAPGDTATSTVLVEPGNAVVACFITSADGTVHVLKGMVAPFRVLPNTAPEAAEPHTTFDIALHDYTITMPNGLHAGPHLFRVDNRGTVTHDLLLLRLSPGADTTDAMAWLRTPAVGSPRAHPIGGIVGEDHGLHSYFFADLTPGNYMVLCWMPDVKTGVPHFYAHHMWTTFHVSS